MYNRLYKYLTTEKLLYSNEFCFQIGLLTEHAIVKLVDQIYKSFEKDYYTWGVFADLSKTFDTVDHIMLIKGIKGINIVWFRSYLTSILRKFWEKLLWIPDNLFTFNYKVPKIALNKSKLESHLEGLPSGITFYKILKKKLNHFRFLNLNWNWNYFLSTIKLHTFK